MNESNQPDVIGDPKRVERILLALVSNAIKFTESGGAVSIKLFVASDNGKVIQLNLTVADTGIGLTEDQITQIYEPLYRASPAYEAQYKGAGTGLTIVKKYIADIKGQIACQSSPGNGAKFIVAIPFKRSIITLDELNSD